MLKSIGLENYKCFKDRTDIEIAPLTVLCGVNSSGKSSILKSLLMLKQSYENESPYNELLFTGDYVDNGFFDDVIFHRNINDIDSSDTFTISNTFILRDNGDKNGYSLRKRQDSSSFRELKRIFYKKGGSIDCFELKITIEVAKQNHKAESPSVYIENNYIKEMAIEIKLKKQNNYIKDKECSLCITKTNDIDERIYEINCINLPNNYGVPISTNFTCICYFSKMHLSNIYQKKMSEDVRAIRPILLSICNIAALQYNGMDFIAPLRHNPERNYLIKGNVDSVGISGENTAILLAKIQNNKISTDIYCPYGKLNEPNNTVDKEMRHMSYRELLQQWMTYLELGDIEINHNGSFVSLDISGHSIVDTGFGVSQTLPILLQGIYMCPDQTLLLEQPEIHLHPHMQLNISDFLITLAEHERNIILETHSDHIINRIIRRMMENEETRRKIKIYFVDQNDDSVSSIEEVKVDPIRGALIDNENFFTQFASETEKMIHAGFMNKKKG